MALSHVIAPFTGARLIFLQPVAQVGLLGKAPIQQIKIRAWRIA